MRVVLRHYPVVHGREVMDYYRTLLREIALINAGGPDAHRSAPERLRSLVHDAHQHYREINRAWNEHVRTAIEERQDHTDVVLSMTPAARDHALRLGHLLREVDRYARRGLLLTPPTPPAVAQLRDWHLHEIVEQIDGAPPVPWPEWDRHSGGRKELLAEAVKARKEAERANAALRGVVHRLDSLVQQEHHIAQTLQRAMFSEDLPELPGLEVSARYLPGAAELTVGGDWYDVVVTGDCPLLVIGDVAGHGLHAAAVMARIRHALHFAAGERTSPAELLSRLNDFFVRTPGDDLATVHVLRIDTDAGVVRYSSAGHPPPVLRAASGACELLESGLGPPLGAVSDMAFPEAVQPFEPGDVLVLYTDGLIERRGEPLDQSLDRLVAAVDAAPDAVDELISSVLGSLLEDEPSDDVAVLAVRL